MGEFNPYAPSKASMAPRTAPAAVDSEVRVWRDGKTVIALHDATLPARCVKCNEPAELPTKVRSLYWVNPFVYLLFFAGLLILLIVYLIVRKKADVDPGMCAVHKSRRIWAITGAWLGFIGGFVVLFNSNEMPALVVIGCLMILAAPIVGLTLGRLVYVKKITKDEVRLGGFCREYLDDLPEYPG
jgi:hypothetical protein